MKEKSLPKIALIAIISYSTMIVFLQNFLLSNSFSALQFYCFDDAAFHESLKAFSQLYGKDMFSLNVYMQSGGFLSYGYGWIFWAVMCIITLPARVIFDSFGVSWSLIIAPRMFSLFFAVMCSVMAYKIIGKYTKNEWIKLAVVICLPMFPAGAHFAGRFSTVSVGAFFSMFAIWLVIRNDTLTRKDLRLALLSFAVAIGIKVSAVVAAPMLALLILNRYGWKFNSENLKLWISECLIVVVETLFFISPAILFYPFMQTQARASIDILWSYMQKNQSISEINNPFELISHTNYNWISWLFCILLVVMFLIGFLGVFKDKRQDLFLKDYMAISIGLVIGVLYICLTINSGVDYQYMYCTAISFAIPMGLVILQHIPKVHDSLLKYGIAMVCTICCISQLFYIRNNDILLSYLIPVKSVKDQIETIEPIHDAISDLGLDTVVMLADYQAPYMVYNSLESKNFLYRICVWNNDLYAYTDEQINVILYSKLAPGSKSDEEFQNMISTYDPVLAEAAIQDRNARKLLVDQGIFNQKKWVKIYEDEFSYIFVREDVV